VLAVVAVLVSPLLAAQVPGCCKRWSQPPVQWHVVRRKGACFRFVSGWFQGKILGSICNHRHSVATEQLTLASLLTFAVSGWFAA
jgi:hypothetical protein